MGDRTVETDVLVIGGGMAGCFAAIKAREQGVEVTLVDKGYAGKSGQTPFAGSFAVFNPAWGHRLDAWMNQVNTIGEYVNNPEWTELVFRESYARYQDLCAWGVKFQKMDRRQPPPRRTGGPTGGNTGRPPPRRPRPPRVSETMVMEEYTHAELLRKQVVKSGVTILDRVMVTDIIKQDGRVVGAVGIPLTSFDVHVFTTRATVLCTGAGAFKSAGWPILPLSADGHAMAYRAGAEITGKEFEDFHSTCAEVPAYLMCTHPHLLRAFGKAPGGGPPMRGRSVNAEGNEVERRGGLTLAFEAHAGRAPVFQGATQRVGGAASGMSVHTAEGVWPTDTTCASSVPGLYAAGDSLGTMFSGAAYSATGSALATAAVTGTRAGIAAAEYAKQRDMPTITENALTPVKTRTHVPIKRRGGFGPRWVTQLIQNLMIPYYITQVKHKTRLRATLTLVEFLRDHIEPKVMAKDPHELRLAHEIRNMILNAEMRLRASLFRTESRGGHYREDYPHRKDPEWLAWVLLKEEKGEMKQRKESIPKKWWPNLKTSYDARYSYKFPGD